MVSRLQSLRKTKDMTISKLAEYLNVTTRTISNWEKDASKIPAIYLILIARLFNVSIDYLLYLTNEKNALGEEANNVEEIRKSLKKLENRK